MKKHLILLALACFGLSGCETSPLVAPEEGIPLESVLSLEALADFEPPQECPGPQCLLDPVSIMRRTRAPVRETRSFVAVEGRTGTLVILASDPENTTVKAWLNGVVVLLPSALPRSGSEEIRVPVTLSEENVLEVRMSAKPGTMVAFWVLDGEDPPIGGSVPQTVFRLTSEVFGPTDDMTGACAQFGEAFGMADWTAVVQAVEDGASKGDVLSDPFALILNNGAGDFNTGFPFFENRHYALSAIGPDPQTEDSVGTEMFWLTSTANSQPVLCIGPAS